MIEPGTKWPLADYAGGAEPLAALVGRFAAKPGTPSLPEASLYVYRLDEGQKDEQLPHDQDEFYLVLEGKRTLWLKIGDNKKRVRLEQNDIVYVPKGAEHRFHGTARFVALVVFAPEFTGPRPAEPEATIHSRDDLLAALREACRVEHGLLVQYLYAAFALVNDPGDMEGADWERIRRIKREILKIAREEMAHLGTVANLMVGLGATPDFYLPPFPQVGDRWFPFPFSMEPLTMDAVDRFIRFESPESAVEMAPMAMGVVYDYIGELYRQILKGFKDLDERTDLFIGDFKYQDDGDWGSGLRVFAVESVADVERAIEFVVTEGEGTQADCCESILDQTPGEFFSGKRSHYERFIYIKSMLQKLQKKGVLWTKDVVSNPITEPDRLREGDSCQLNAEEAVQVATIFNQFYLSTLMMLTAFYDPADDTLEDRQLLSRLLKGGMSGVIRPLGEILTDLPATTGKKSKRAGAPFEIDGHVSVAPQSRVRWLRLEERLDVARKSSAELAREAVHPRLESVSRNLEIMLDSVRTRLQELG